MKRTSWRLMLILGVLLAGCGSGDEAATTSKADSKAQTLGRYSIIDIEQCFAPSDFDVAPRSISSEEYGPETLTPAEVLGVTKDGACVVVSHLNSVKDRGCSVDTRIRLVESTQKIEIQRLARARLAPPKEGGCSLGITSEAVALQLAEPVGDREIVDRFDRLPLK